MKKARIGIAGLLAVIGVLASGGKPAFAGPRGGIFWTHQMRALQAELSSLDQGNAGPQAGGGLLYFGGPVISNTKVVAVMWGPSVKQEVVGGMGAFYDAALNSTYMDWLTEYNTVGLKAVDGRDGTNQTINRGRFLSTVIITPTNSSRNLSDEQLQAELEAQIEKGVLPRPDADTLYMMHFPPGIKITIDGMSSCSSFCAYHMGFNSKKYDAPIFYGVMPDMGGACSFGCGMGSSYFDTTTYVSSHEMIEAITDPFPTPGDKPAYPQAWNDRSGSEISDLCSSPAILKARDRTYKVTMNWSNKAAGCVGGTYTQ